MQELLDEKLKNLNKFLPLYFNSNVVKLLNKGVFRLCLRFSFQILPIVLVIAGSIPQVVFLQIHESIPAV